MPFENSYFIKLNAEFVYNFSNQNLAPMFRRKFTLENTGDAKLYICGLGYAYCYINGKKISEDLFTAPISDYNKTLWYNVYDVSDFLKKGENVIAVICGNGWYNESIPTNWKFHEASWRDNPKFILSLTLNGEIALVSDDSWKTKNCDAIYFNQLRMGEYFDANLYDDRWNSLDYDDIDWQNSIIDKTPPKGVLRECQCEPIRECKIFSPVRRIQNGVSSYVYDFGQNMSGYVRLTASGRKGQELTIRYAECLSDKNQLEYYGMDKYYLKSGFQTDKFICSGKSVTWSPRFAYHGFRYIEISGLSNPEDIEVFAVFVHQDIDRRTSFKCSDSYLNKMFDCAVMSSWSNMFYMPTDCPSREKFFLSGF